MKITIFAFLLCLLSNTVLAQTSVSIQGVVPGWPHNVHRTDVFNGTWNNTTPQGDRRVVVTPIDPSTGKYRVSCQNLLNGNWHSSWSVETINNEYRYRMFIYRPGFNPVIIGENPPIIVRVN